MGDFDWNIWGTKLVKKIIFGAVLGGLIETAAFLGTEPVPTEYAWMTIFAVEAIEIILNGLKHSV